MADPANERNQKSALPVLGAVLAGIGASACCSIPFVAVLLGLSGGWLSTLGAFERFRPLFILGAAAFLGYGFWKAYGRARPKTGDCCEEDAACAVVSPARRRANLVMLWLGALFTVALIASPYLIPLFVK